MKSRVQSKRTEGLDSTMSTEQMSHELEIDDGLFYLRGVVQSKRHLPTVLEVGHFGRPLLYLVATTTGESGREEKIKMRFRKTKKFFKKDQTKPTDLF